MGVVLPARRCPLPLPLAAQSEHQIEESQKAVAHIDAIIGDPDRLHAVAEDFINHYETRVAEGATVAGKAMFVCSNRKIAYAFYQIIVGMRPEWAEKKVCPDGVELTEKEKKVILLYYYEDMTLKEISSILEVSESRVSQLHTKALLKMRKRMGNYMGILID